MKKIVKVEGKVISSAEEMLKFLLEGYVFETELNIYYKLTDGILKIIDGTGEEIGNSDAKFNQVYINIYNSVYEIEEEKWYDNIPEQGILCWASNENDIPNRNDSMVRIFGIVDGMFSISSGAYLYKYAIPVTKEEVLKHIYDPN